jgi:hypothetical protein
MFATPEGMIEVIFQNSGYGTYEDAVEVFNALNKYKAQFAYKCTYTWCNDRKQHTYGNRGQPGFPSLQDLETHRLTHPYHGLRTIRYSVIGTPWYECECTHSDNLNDEELALYLDNHFDGVPQARLDHLERVNGN